jgi:type IV secretion system protein VirB11
MVKASPEGAGLEYAAIQRLLRATIDIVVHIAAHRGRRHITAIEFDPARDPAG